MAEIKTNIPVESDILLNVHSRSLVDHPALQEEFIPLSQNAQAELLAEQSPKHKLLAEVQLLQRDFEDKRLKLVAAQKAYQEAAEALNKGKERFHIQEMYKHISDMEAFYHGFRGKLSELCGHFDHDHPEVDQMLHWFHGVENSLHALGVSKLSETHVHPEWSLDNIRKIVEHETFDILEAHQEHSGKFAGVSTALDRLLEELSGNPELETLHIEAVRLRKDLDSRKKRTSEQETGIKTSSLMVDLAMQTGGIHPTQKMKDMLAKEKAKRTPFSNQKGRFDYINTAPELN